MALVGVAFSLGFILGPALGGWASTMDPLGSDAQGVFVLNEFSLAAVISLALGILNWAWLASRFKETLPLEKRAAVDAPKPAIFRSENPIPPFAKRVCPIFFT